MREMIEISKLSIKNEPFQFNKKNVLVESGLAKDDVKDAIEESAITHLEIEKLNSSIKKNKIEYHYKLVNMIAYPADYRKFFEETRGSNSWDIHCSNYGLALEKFGRNIGKKLDYVSSEGQDNLHFKNSEKKHDLENILNLAKKGRKKIFEEYGNKGLLIQLSLKQNWRMVLNLGATTAYNNGFLLHKIYGVPYLPGQAIKGVLRHYVITTYFESDEKKAWRNSSFRMLFGNEEVNDTIKAQQSKAVFFDVFPSNDKFKIEADIMNPHNTNYYAQKDSKYPNDTTDPKPIKFLTLKDASFNLTVFVTKKMQHEKIEFSESKHWNTPKEALEELLKEAMWLQGIGAKTNLGYGRLDIDEEKQEALDKEKEEKRKKEEEKERKIEEENNKREEAENNGIYLFIKPIFKDYGKFKEEIRKYRELLELPADALLPEKDHQIILDKLTILKKNKQPKFRKIYKSQKVKQYISIQVGTEKMELWIEEHFPN